MAVDAQGNLYFMTGNGTFDTNLNSQGMPGQGDYGDSFVKLAIDPSTSPNNQNPNGWGLKVVDYFTPFDQVRLASGDIDQGSGGILLLPVSVGSAAHSNLLVGAGKEGRVYLIDLNNMGHYSGTTDHSVEHHTAINGSWSTPAYFNGEFYYFGGNTDNGKAFSINNGSFSSSPVSKTPDTFGSQGDTASISANGTVNGIVWVLDRASNELRAYDATNLANELYTSDQAANGRDQIGSVVKFSVPTVINGKVFVGTTTGLAIYGLLSANAYPPPAPTNLKAAPVSGTQINLTWSLNSTSATGIHVERFDGRRPFHANRYTWRRCPVLLGSGPAAFDEVHVPHSRFQCRRHVGVLQYRQRPDYEWGNYRSRFLDGLCVRRQLAGAKRLGKVQWQRATTD